MNNTIFKKIKNLLILAGLFSLLLLVFAGCDSNKEQILPSRTYKLVWEDDFNGTKGSFPDTTNTWNIETHPSYWVNSEYQSYVKSTDNLYLDGTGNLAIKSIRTLGSDGNYQYSSARINSKGKKEQTYGRIEARMKLPYGPGLWPAFWMLGANDDLKPWPACGEIDIMELNGGAPQTVHGSAHGTGKGFDQPGITKTYSLTTDRFDTGFHVFAIEWGLNYIDYYVDNILYEEITPASLPSGATWPFDHSFYIIFNLAVGGNFVSDPTPDNVFPQTMLVDYVKVFEEIK